ncbi:hypothetical protein B0T14DRAFT_585158, partial [Immersiella caudata]
MTPSKPATSSSPWALETPVPYSLGKRHLNWQIDDPAGQGVDAVRLIRNEIRGRIKKLYYRTRLLSMDRI